MARLFLVVAGLAGATVLAGAAPPSQKSEAAVRESILRLTAGDAAGAEAEARLAVQAAPSVRALQQLARAANAVLDFATAEDAAGRALTAAPSAALFCLRSEARAGRGDYAGALADARSAARLSPASATAVLRLAIAKEGLHRPPAEALADYRRAAELDPSLAPLRDAASERLTLPPPRSRSGWGGLIGLLAVSGLLGWGWAHVRGDSGRPPALAKPPRAALPGAGRLTPRDAARALAGAAKTASGPEAAFELAESLYERLTGRRPDSAPGDGFVPPSQVVPGLPVGIDAFFARALDPDAARRFRSGAELSGAFRSLVDPAVE